MGIQGLLKALKPFTQPVHVKKYSGQRVGIDAYSWLHKGAYSCSMELCEQSGLAASKDPAKLKYVNYCMHRINMLKYHKVIPVMVFDGGRLPLKAGTERERQRQRQVNLGLARKKKQNGDLSGAIELFQRAVEITPLMAHELIRVLKANGVEFVVAPYEADAQLAWLAKLPAESGGVAAVLSEDSDLLAYGCPRVIFKMDKFGNGEEISLAQVFNSGKASGSNLSFQRFTQDLFLGMCVLAGCDFLPSIPGIGIMKAYSIVAKYCNLDRVLSQIDTEHKITVPEGYVSQFWQARAIFLHARVYDGTKCVMGFLNPLPEDFEDKCGSSTDFLGPELSQSLAKGIAQGSVDPITWHGFQSFPNPKPGPGFFRPPVNHLQTEHVSSSERGPFAFLSTTTRAVSINTSSVSPVPVSQARAASCKDEADPSFRAQLQLLATKARSRNSSALQDYNGQKRFLSPLPDNNPFKKARPVEQAEEDSGASKSDFKENEWRQAREEDPAAAVECTTQASFQPQDLSQESSDSILSREEDPAAAMKRTTQASFQPQDLSQESSDSILSHLTHQREVLPFLDPPGMASSAPGQTQWYPDTSATPSQGAPEFGSPNAWLPGHHQNQVYKPLVKVVVAAPRPAVKGSMRELQGNRTKGHQKQKQSLKQPPPNSGILRFFKPLSS